ncbi:MAG: BTAD domain-containing putative transcriptional regulator, partial [Gemmatimonadota bacterium]
MVRLRTLGGLTIENHPFDEGIAAQRRPLALLAVLALAGPRGVSRDKIVALLWPDSDNERARNSLSQALTFLRRHFGDEIVLGSGDLSLNSHVVTSDVAEFESHLAAGDLEAAANMYHGPFLDGVHIRNAPDFERWVDGERRRLQHSLGNVLDRLATAASDRGEYSVAVAWARKGANLAPTDSRAALSLMKALAASGDQAGALEHYRIHEALVRQDLDIAPDPTLQHFVSELRRGAMPAGTTPNVYAPGVAKSAPGADIEPIRQPAPRRFGRAILTAGSLIALVLAGFYVAQLRRTPASSEGGTRRQLTFAGNALMAAIAPDKQFIAYVIPSADSQRVVVQHTSGGKADTILSVLGGYPGIVSIEWSPDGAQLLVGSDGRALLVPRFGGAVRQIGVGLIGPQETYATWITGSRVSLHGVVERRALILDLDKDLAPETLEFPGAYAFVLDGAWSPNGRVFAVTQWFADPARFTIAAVTDDGRSAVVVDDSLYVGAPQWSAAGDAIYYARDADELRRVPVDP